MTGRHATAALLAAAIALGTLPAAARDRTIVLKNATDTDMVEFYASNKATRAWEEDILGRRVLPAWRSVTIDLNDGSKHCRFDFKAVFADGEAVTKYGVNVCKITEFTFYEAD